MGKEIGRSFKYNRSKIPTSAHKKPVYHFQLLIHNLQVILHDHPSHLNLIIKTVLQIKTRTTPQI